MEHYTLALCPHCSTL